MQMKNDIEVTSRRGRKSGPKEVVARLSVEVFETFAEAAQFFGGEETALGLLNTQHETNSKNEARRLANTTLSDRKVRQLATDRVFENRELLVQISNADDMIGEKDRLIELAMVEIQAEQEAAKQAAAPMVESLGDEPPEADEDE